ncbi:hypothetical protein A2U01_0038411, partial [Trifolium medium]|nr:hypothetical protein [Trifolium medium]
MARTKESAKKQIHDHNVSSSPSSSPSHSPSPPPPKTPDHVSDSMSDSPPSTQNLIDPVELNPVSKPETIRSEDLITPISTIVVPSVALTPPILTKPKRTKSIDRYEVRKSAHIMSGIGTGRKPIIDTTVHVIHNSDS